MSSSRGPASPAPILPLRAVLAGDRGARRRLVTAAAALGLWLLAWGLIATAPLPESGILVYRVDANQIAAYPRSDAAMDYLNAMAIRSGDGWVNWRDTNRWSVYRPGWGAFLAGLAVVTGGEPAAMQAILGFLLAASAPALMLLLLHLYPGPGGLPLAVAAALAWTLRPFFGWQLQRTMMSEGPTLLLAVVFCLLTLRFCQRLGEWSWRQGLVLGLVAGALSLVRGQSRFGLLLVAALLLLASLRALRHRLGFFAGLACGVLVIAGPLFLKTSWHLRLPYAGTSYTALYNTLQYTPVGRRVGGTGYPGGEPLAEREAMRLFSERVRRGIAEGLERPGRMLREGSLHFSRAIHASVATLAGVRLPPPKKRRPVAAKLLLLYGLAGLGLVFAWRRAGPAALAPLVFAVGYFAPTVPFWFYSNRLGMPISWVGWVYVAGALLALPALGARLLRRGSAQEPPPGASGAADERQGVPAAAAPAPGWPARWLLPATGAWLVAATGLLLWLDLRPLPGVKVERLLADPRSREALERAGIAAGPGLLEEAGAVLDRDVASDRLLAGVALLPMTISPGDRPVLQPFSRERLAPADRPYGVLYLVSPWKRGGRLGMWRVRLPGAAAAAGIRHGEAVLVLRQPGSPVSVGKNRVVRLSAAAVLPTRWAE